MSNLDLSKIKIVPTKLYHKVLYGPGKLRICTPPISLPFGVEAYNKKEIVNIVMDKKVNSHNNLFADIDLLDRIVDNFSGNRDNKSQLPFIYANANLFSDVKGKQYISAIRENTITKILRTTVAKNISISKMVNNKKVMASRDDVKGCKAICKITFDNIWVYGQTYGMGWIIEDICII